MALEIERRFLVQGEGWRRHSRWQRRLQQGYLVSDSAGLVLRVRTSRPMRGLEPPAAGAGPVQSDAAEGAQAWLTLKLPLPEVAGSALSRQEFEYAIPLADAEALLTQCTSRLVKQRHGLDLPGGAWVLDVFEGSNAPLVVAEVELKQPDQEVQPPLWCVHELTGRHELSNAALARHPFASWDAAARAALLGASGS